MGCGTCGGGHAAGSAPAEAWQTTGATLTQAGPQYRYVVTVRGANGQAEEIEKNGDGHWLTESEAYALVSKHGGGGVNAVLIQ